MAMLPGWNSLEAVGSIGHSLHMAAIVVLAMLVVAEGLALVYDDRKYALVGAAEREITVSRDQEALAVTERHQNEIAVLQRELEEAQRQQPSLRLTIIGQRHIIALPGAADRDCVDTRRSGRPAVCERLRFGSAASRMERNKDQRGWLGRQSLRYRSPL